MAAAGTSREEALLELGTQLNVLLSSARSFTARTAANFGPAVSGASFQVLQWLHSAGATRSTRVAEALAMDRSALSRLLQQLNQAHLVEAQPDPTDGRVTVYALTKDGRKKMDRALVNKGSRFSKRLQGWSDAEVFELAKLLARLNETGDD
jgi:DNA-binding MarR family transcriptional regulator